MTIATVLEDWLPTKWSRRTAISTLPTAISAVFLLGFLSPVLPSTEEANLRFLQIALFLAIALIGAIIVLALVILHYRDSVAKWPTERYLKLPEYHRVILAISSITKPNEAKIAAATCMSEESVSHWVAFWREQKCLDNTDKLSLTDKGHKLAATI